MTNNTTPLNTRSNAVNQPLATQQPTTTEKIKDSVKSAVNKAQNVLTGSNTKTMTPPTSNDATHVIGDNRRHHEKADIVGNVDVPKNRTSGNVVGVHGTNEPHRHEGVVNKVEGAAGNAVGKVEGTTERLTGMHHDGRDRHGLNNDVNKAGMHGTHGLGNDVNKTGMHGTHGLGNDVDKIGMHGTHGLGNDVGYTDKHDAKYTGYDNRIDQQTGAVPQRTNLVPPPPQQQLDNKLTGNAERSAAAINDNAFNNDLSGSRMQPVGGRLDNTGRAANDTGNNAFTNARRGNDILDVDFSNAGPTPTRPSDANPDLSKPSAIGRTDEARRF
ncbi:hypothetical protein GGH13_008499 [Coemansia sp. S155-1]|nr:hypothetical protein GGH13_008499 [Coemansia sp. S155-1]